MSAKIAEAALTHDVQMWFCGLDSDDHYVTRERYPAALTSLIVLLPKLARLQVYDNSKDAAPGEPTPDPVFVAEMVHGKLVWPTTPECFQETPEWAKPILAAGMTA